LGTDNSTSSLPSDAQQGVTNASFTGTRLANVFDAAGGAVLPNDVNNARLRMSVMVTGGDGYQVLFAWGDLDPDFAEAPPPLPPGSSHRIGSLPTTDADPTAG
jgi:hypothetical protein